MTAALRLLYVVASSPIMAEEPETVNGKSDYVVVLAALSCALVCAVGLALVARCACLHRRLSLSSAVLPGMSPNHSVQQPLPLAPAPPGLKKKSLRLLPTATYASGGKISECAICLTEFSDGNLLRLLPQCGHVFHVDCIDKWLGCHSSCPSCRELVVLVTPRPRCNRCGELQETDQSSTPVDLKTGREYANGFLP